MSTTGRGARTALVVALATTVAAVAPLYLVLSVLTSWIDLGALPTWAGIPIGLSLFAAVLALPTVGWGLVVAHAADAPRRRVVRTALRVGLPLAPLVAILVDLSQILIDTVWPWHRLAVHALFTVAFAAGLATFLGTVTGRVAVAIARDDRDTTPRTPGRVGLGVAVATTVGVVLASAVAIGLGWTVRPGMGTAMLRPLYLVVLGGTAAGGAVFGRALAATGTPSPALRRQGAAVP